MVVYDIYNNGQFIKTVTPCCQGIMEIHDYMSNKIMPELAKEFGENVVAKRRIEKRERLGKIAN